MTAVYRSAERDAVLVERAGAFDVLAPGERWTAFTLPADAVELLDPDEGAAAVLERVRAALAAVTMSKKARADVAHALDELEPE